MIKTEPLMGLLACVVWIPIAVWVVSMVHWMVTGEVDGITGFLSILAMVTLGFFANNSNPDLVPFYFAGITLAVVLFPYVRGLMSRRACAQVDLEVIDSCSREILMRSDNIPARLRMADVLVNRGRLEDAVAIAEEALASAPKDFYPVEEQRLSTWKRALAARGQTASITACLQCGMREPPGTIICSRCGALVLVDSLRGTWGVHSQQLKRAIGALVLGMFLLVGIPATLRLPPALAIGLIVTQLAIGSYAVIRALLKMEASAQ